MLNQNVKESIIIYLVKADLIENSTVGKKQAQGEQG